MSVWIILFTMVIIGIIFLFLEITILPGVGIAGILGGMSLLGAFSYAFYLALFAKTISINLAMAFVALSLTGGIASVILGIKIFPKTKFGKSMILASEQREEDGYIGVESGLENFLGEIGVAETDLRPAGYGRINGEKIDVKSDGDYIKKGENIKVIKIESNSVVVERCAEESVENEDVSETEQVAQNED